MRLSIVNPNTSGGITDLLAASALSVCAPTTRLAAYTATKGVPYISSRAEALIGGTVALEMIADVEAASDAVVIAAFGDPGLLAARQLFDVPVVGMSEASMLTACMLGRRFAIVTFNAALADWYQDCVEACRMTARLSGILASSRGFRDVRTVQQEAQEELVALSRQAVATGAEAIILGGAPLAGLAPRIRDLVPVPVIDPVAAAVKQAEALVAMQPRKPLAGSHRRPDAKPTVGLPSSLAAKLEHADFPCRAEAT